MNLPQPLLNHIDKTSIKLLEILVKKKEEKVQPQNLRGSLSEKVVEDWSDKIDTFQDTYYHVSDYKNQHIEYWSKKRGYDLGYNKDSYKEFKKFIDSLYKRFEINSISSWKFVEKIVFKWIIDTKENNQAQRNLSEHLVNEIEASIETITYCFPVHYLEIPEVIKIGDVELGFFTKDDWDEIEAVRSKIEEDREGMNKMRKRYQGAVIVKTVQTGEYNKAKQLALERCCLALDILKIHSEVLYIPDYWSDFNIDIKAKPINRRTIFTHDPNGIGNFTISLESACNVTHFTKENIKKLNDTGMKVLGPFISQKGKKSELSKMVINSIEGFSETLSNRDQHKRISEIFSIYESLLVPNKSAHILESLKKYGPKLIHDKPAERTEFKKLIKKMYDVRCDLVHHGERKDFEQEDLITLQIGLISLICKLVILSEKHETKQSILKEIDDAINAA